jgi:hypothetical protein
MAGKTKIWVCRKCDWVGMADEKHPKTVDGVQEKQLCWGDYYVVDRHHINLILPVKSDMVKEKPVPKREPVPRRRVPRAASYKIDDKGEDE